MSKTLVLYFSASSGGVTRKAAERLAKAADADLFEIKPAEPYSEADINWKNPFSRCNKEWIGKKDVPAAEYPESLADYDKILVGFPIWYGIAPLAVSCFLRKCDLSGKKLGIFATSGGSKMGKSAEKLKPYLSEGCVIAGEKLITDSDSDASLAEWANAL